MKRDRGQTLMRRIPPRAPRQSRGLPAAEPATCEDPETPVHILKPRTWHAALQDQYLLPEAKIVCDQQRLWLGSRSKHPQQTAKHCLSPCCCRLMLFNAANGKAPRGSQFCALHLVKRADGSDALLVLTTAASLRGARNPSAFCACPTVRPARSAPTGPSMHGTSLFASVWLMIFLLGSRPEYLLRRARQLSR